MGKYLGSTGLTYLWGKIKSLLANGTAGKAQSIPFGTVDSTSTATAFTATVDGITELRDGVSLYLKNAVVTSAAASTAPKCWTLNINNLGAKPVYVTTAAATYSTTHFAKNYKMLFTYDTSLNSGNGGWYLMSAPVTSVNNQTGAVTIATGDANVIESVSFNGTAATVTNKNAAITYTPTLSQNYVPSNLLNEGLVIEEGDTHEEAIAKIHKTILDNEEISVRAITDLDTRINYINSHVPKSTSVTQIISISQSEYNALASKDSSTLYIITSS